MSSRISSICIISQVSAKVYIFLNFSAYEDARFFKSEQVLKKRLKNASG